MSDRDHNQLMYDRYGEQYYLKRKSEEDSLWNESAVYLPGK
jgi:hypothetical protein